MTWQDPPIPSFMQQMAEAITRTSHTMSREEMAVFFQKLLSASRIYVAGAGRSGLIAKAFGMRLMHLGYDAYVAGETITPAFHKGDLLVVFSGSGETHSIVSIVETAKDLGGTICLITASPVSRMSRISDCVVNLGDLSEHYDRDQDSFEIRQLTGKYRSVTSAFAPLGTMFETMALIFSDAVISSLMEQKSEELPRIRDRLTNLE